MGEHRRLAAVTAACLALAAGPACSIASAPGARTGTCTVAPQVTLTEIEERLVAFGKLRNGRLVEVASTDRTFVSAELHLYTDGVDERGDILTWVADGDSYRSVDVRARDESTWPPADFDVRAAGAVDSRSCVDGDRGFPCEADPGLPPQIQRQQCEQAEAEEERSQERILAEHEDGE